MAAGTSSASSTVTSAVVAPDARSVTGVDSGFLPVGPEMSSTQAGAEFDVTRETEVVAAATAEGPEALGMAPAAADASELSHGAARGAGAEKNWVRIVLTRHRADAQSNYDACTGLGIPA